MIENYTKLENKMTSAPPTPPPPPPPNQPSPTVRLIIQRIYGSASLLAGNVYDVNCSENGDGTLTVLLEDSGKQNGFEVISEKVTVDTNLAKLCGKKLRFLNQQKLQSDDMVQIFEIMP